MKPRGRIQATANLSIVLQKINAFVKEVGIGLSYSPTQIADGDIKQICGMLWILITKFVIPESEENLSAKRSLLRWVQRVTEPYDNVAVKDFHKSWKDGLAFNALLDQFDSTLMDYSKLDAKNDAKNLGNAFDIAEGLGIYKLLDVEDITEVERPDEKSVMTYVSTMYQYFHKNANRKLEADVKNFVIDVRRLLEWIEKSIGQHSVPESWPEKLPPCYDMEKQVGKFNVVKAKYANYKCNLYVRLAGIQRVQRNERLKVFVPGDDSNLNTVHKKWQELNETVVKYTKELRDWIDKLEEEKRQREEAAIKAKEDEEREKREAFNQKVDKEIKEREAEEAKTRDEDSQFYDDNKNHDLAKIDIHRDLARQRTEELTQRKEEEERKRRDAAFREEEAERLAKEEENRKAKEDAKQKRLEELAKREEEIKKREEEELIARAEFRKKVDQEIKDREKEEKDDRLKDNQFYNDDIENQYDLVNLHRELANRAKEEHISRDEQEKQKRADLERRKRLAERKKKDEEEHEAEEQARKEREEKKRLEDEERAKKELEDEKAREEFRKKCEEEIIARKLEEKENQKDEDQFLDDQVKALEERNTLNNELVARRKGEHLKRESEEKQKRLDAAKRKRDEERKKEKERIAQLEEEEKKQREEFRKQVEKEIEDRQKEEKDIREQDTLFYEDNDNKTYEKKNITKKLMTQRNEELIQRDEQEKQKRADLERRNRAAERAKNNEEQKLKEEEARKESEAKKKTEDEETAKKEEEGSKERAEFRKRVDEEIENRIAEEKRFAEEDDKFLNDNIAADEEKEKIYGELVSQRTSEHKSRSEQEKKKREDADRRARKAKGDKELSEFRQKEDEERKKRDEEKKAADDEINRKFEEDRVKRENERKQKEEDQLAHEDDERRKRKEERDGKFNNAKTKEQKDRKAIGEYDVIAADYMRWVIDTQDKLTSHFEELEEDKEDMSTDKEIREQRVVAVNEAKEKIKPVLEKWKELEEAKITEWSSIPRDEAVYAMETMAYALTGDESENLGKIRQFKMDEEKKEEK